MELVKDELKRRKEADHESSMESLCQVGPPKSVSPVRTSQKIEMTKTRKDNRDYFITPTWDFDPFGPMSKEEKSHLHGLQQ